MPLEGAEKVMIMSGLNEKLKDIYHTYKDHENPPVPVKKNKRVFKTFRCFIRRIILFLEVFKCQKKGGKGIMVKPL